MTSALRRRLDPDARAGLRLTLLGLGALVLVAAVLPLAVLVRDSWGPLADLDQQTDAAAHRAVLAHGWLLDAARVLTYLGAPLLVDLATVLVAVLLVAAGRRRSALFLVTCTAGAYLLSTVGKLAVGRVRPSFQDAVATARGASFPSGHATGSAALYAALAVALLPVLRKRWRQVALAAAVLVPLVVATTRVLLGVHFPSDVTAGLLLGWSWVLACTAVFATWRTEEGRRGSGWRQGVESAG